MQSTFVISSSSDGLELHALEIRPEEEVRGVLVLVHGMAEHKERYILFMEYMASLGYACLIHDHRGHGESVRDPEDLGFMYANGAEAIVEDVQDMVREAERRYPQLPIHMFGHSMGSLIVRCYLQKYDDRLTSLTISGCVAQNPAADAGKFMAALVGKIKGDHYRSPLITAMAFGSYNKAFPRAKSSYAWLNSDEEAVQQYEEDPLCGFVFTANGYENLMKLLKQCYQNGSYQKKNPALPILFLSGADDPCCMGEKGFHGAVDYLKSAGYKNTAGVLLPGMRHEILNEPGRMKVYELTAAHVGAAGLK
ncbi:MAG: alpha/beta fold hydrolase [Lachnospiraceae bacterium]|nr:alpha/beta fold hydrolase [Lachnospiraceae bacterium]